MNLDKAYKEWQDLSQNRELYVKTREAFRKAWFTLPTNKPCSYYTKQILGEALAATREVESVKTNAASVMVHVLTFANFAEPKLNPKPDFTFHDLMEYTRGPLADPGKTGRRQEDDDDKPEIKTNMEQQETTKQRGRPKKQAEKCKTEAAPAPKFKEGDHVWAKKPEDLYGRTGHVVRVDAGKMMYDVRYGSELWTISEADLEPVNEGTFREIIATDLLCEEMKQIPAALYDKLERLGMLPNEVRDHNQGTSDYAEHLIQPWAIWQDYRLNAWDADIVKRVLRRKQNDPRRLDYEKIIHICQERIRQIDHGEDDGR